MTQAKFLYPVSIRIDDIEHLSFTFGDDLMDAMAKELIRRIEGILQSGESVAGRSPSTFTVLAIGVDDVSVKARFRRFQRELARSPVKTVEGVVPTTISIDFHERVSRDETVILSASDWICTSQNVSRRRAFSKNELMVKRPTDAQELNKRQANAVANALEKNCVRIALQPIVSVHEVSESAGYECLARFVDEDSGAVSMQGILPRLDELQFARFVDRCVLEIAIQWLALHSEGRLSVNLSPQTLNDIEWFERVDELASSDPKAASRITIEITEITAIEDRSFARERVAFLQSRGFRVALDDFGVGYLSFGHLRDLKPDILKIDGSFVSGLPDDRDGAAFVTAIAGLARHLGITVVAEMAAPGPALDFLRRVGVDYVQGFGFGEPKLWAYPAV